MNNTMLVKIIMPSEIVFTANATMINIPGGDGMFGVLPGHAKLISTVEIGIVKVFFDGKEERFFVYKGIAQVTPLELNIVSEFAISMQDQNATDILDKIASLNSELEICEKNSLEAEQLNASIVRYNSLLKFVGH